MEFKKIVVALSCIGVLSSSLYAQKPDFVKQKNIPHGLQKKLDKGGELPPGWKKKISKGQVLDDSILMNGKILRDRDYRLGKDIKDGVDSTIYKIEDKVIRVSNVTREILEILK